MSKLLEQELNDLQQRVETMATAVRQAFDTATTALLEANADAGRVICEGDTAINEQRFALENDAVAVIATQQPVAGDVRLLAGILEIVIELERMGDYAKNIAQTACCQAERGAPARPDGISQMSKIAGEMLTNAIKSFADRDADLARSVADQDDEIDNLCWTLHRDMLQRAYTDQAEVEQAIRLLPVVHDIERFADRATNICERVVYIVSGEQVEYSVRKEI